MASTTNGTIDSTYHYGWGENAGWVDFGSTAGTVHITDSALSGSVYGENVGWIDLSTITNNGEGTLSGYAWGENVGWVDFSHTTIGSDGVFAGGAYGENIGWITFGTGNNKVMTDWRPASSRSSSSSGSHHSGSVGYIPKPVTVNVPSTSACNAGEKFSITTGLPCPTFIPNLSSALGGTGQATLLPQCSITSTLKYGNKNAEVKCLQTILKVSPISGYFGPITKAAVMAFQKSNKLTPDGIVGPITRSKLK